MKIRDEFYRFGLEMLGYKSQKDLFEKLYLKAIIDSYSRIDKTIGQETEIRDRFILDLENKNELTTKLIQNDILQLDFERWHFVNDTEKRRTDISFFISGLGKFILECKLLFQQESKNKDYINDGLKRFIDLKYSEKSQFAGMLGFVISGEIKIITKNLKDAVGNFHFYSESKDLLNTKCVDWDHSFQSQHDRINDTRIHIYHLLFDFSENN